MEWSTISKFTFSRGLQLKRRDYEGLSQLIEQGINAAENTVEEELGEHLLSFLPEVELKKNETITVSLEMSLDIAPFTPKIQKEREIAERAAEVFFERLEK